MSYAMLMVMKATEQRLQAAITDAERADSGHAMWRERDNHTREYMVSCDQIESIRSDLYRAILELKELAK